MMEKPGIFLSGLIDHHGLSTLLGISYVGNKDKV